MRAADVLVAGVLTLALAGCSGGQEGRAAAQRKLDTLDRALRADIAGVAVVTKAVKDVCADSSPPMDDLTVTAPARTGPPDPKAIVDALQGRGWAERPVPPGNLDYALMSRRFGDWTGFVTINRAATGGWLSAETDDGVVCG